MTGDSGQVPAEPRREGPGHDSGGPRGSAAAEIRSTPVPVSATPGLLTEGPRWHAERGQLLWVDILGHTLHRGRPGVGGALESVATITVDRPVGAVAPAIGGGYVLAAGTGFLYVDDEGAVEELAQPEAGRTDVRMNDGPVTRRAASGPARWPTTSRRGRGCCIGWSWTAAVPPC
jgi:sugar lactone lactonase YvrE